MLLACLDKNVDFYCAAVQGNAVSNVICSMEVNVCSCLIVTLTM